MCGQGMKLSKRDQTRLTGVHPKLIEVCVTAFELFDDAVIGITGSKLIITEGVRTLEKQREYFKAGKSWTMNSYHLDGRAIDFAITRGSDAFWEYPLFEKIWLACFRPAGHRLGVRLTWGGHWGTRDSPHIQIELNAKSVIKV